MPTSSSPPDYLYREVKPNWSGLFEKLTELSASFDPRKWPEAVPKIYKALGDLFRLKPQTIEEEVFSFVKTALARAVREIVKDNLRPEDRKLTPVGGEAARRLDALLQNEPVLITQAFFKSPTRASVVGAVARHLASWLRTAGLSNEEADAAVVRFQATFAMQLAREHDEHAENYKKLAERHKPNFTAQTDTNWNWFQYFTKLQTRANPEVLDLGISLDDVYVELRAYTEPRLDGTDGVAVDARAGGQPQKRPRTIGLLTKMAEAWIEDARDAVFVLSGGPGSGKSAFSRRFAAWRAWSGPEPWRVLYVPLHRFNASGELKAALNEFAGRELSSHDSVDLFQRDETERFLIVFDGLDELSQQGAVGEEVAAEFYQRLDSFVKDCNRESTPVLVKVLVCGRPVAVGQTNAEMRKAERVRHVLPYRIDKIFDEQTQWRGQADLSKRDQRDEWWVKYGLTANYSELTEMPAVIRTITLDPLTAEPILNGLIAKCLKNTHRKIAKDTNRAMIYEWMLTDVIDRVHDASGNVILPGRATEDIAQLLEQVAVSAWHNGDVRATTKSRVKDHCEKAGLTELLDRVFPDKAKSNITSLFLAFYFQ